MPAAAPDAGFSAFAAEQGPRFVRTAMLLTGSLQDAEDAVQDAMVDLARAWPRVRRDTAGAYARRIVARRALDVIARRRDLPVAEPPEVAADDAALLAYEEDRAFFDRLRDLPDRQRAVLVLRYHEDLPDAQIARLLGIDRGTVRSQAARALEKLREAEG